MDDLPIKDRALFLKYAIPCGSILVKRGEVPKKTMDKLRDDFLAGRPIEQDLDKIFRVGVRMLSLTALEMGKSVIDREVIRRYFWFEHPACLRLRAQEHPDIEPALCTVLPARVLETGRDVLVDTPLGKRTVRPDFTPGIKPGDRATVHYSHIVEKISEKDADSLNRFIEKGAKINK